MAGRKQFLIVLPAAAAAVVLGAILVLREWRNPERSPRGDGSSADSAATPEGSGDAGIPNDPAEAALHHLRKAVDVQLAGRPARDERALALGRLRKAGESALAMVVRVLKDPDEKPMVKFQLLALLAESGLEGVDRFFITLFRGRDLEERYRSLALARVTTKDDEALFSALSQSLREERLYGGRHLVVRAIGESGKPEATPLLLESLAESEPPAVRIEAVRGLSSRTAEPGVAARVREVLLKDPDENVRLAAVAALARSGDEESRTLLREIAENPEMSPRLRAAAEGALRRDGRK